MLKAEGNISVWSGSAPGSCRGRGAGHAGTGVLQEPGRSYRFRLGVRMGKPETSPRPMSGGVRSGMGTKKRAQGGI